MVTDIYNFDDNILQIMVLKWYVRSEFPNGQIVGPQTVSSYGESRKHLIGVSNCKGYRS
jgi:hypothetical protein